MLSVFTSLILHVVFVGVALVSEDSDKNSNRLISVRVINVASTSLKTYKISKQEVGDKKRNDLKVPIKEGAKFFEQNKNQRKLEEQNSETRLTSGEFSKDSLETNSAISRKADTKWLKSQTPNYPEKARMMGWQGKVLLNVVMTREGKVKDVKVVKSSGYQLLDNSAMEAVWLWEGAPDNKNSDSEIISFEVPISFKLE